MISRLLNHRLATPLILAMAAVCAFVVLRLRDPTQPGSGLPPCPFFTVTGLLCPGCGSTRALHGLVHFDLPAALSMNPLLVISLPLVVLLTAYGANLLPNWLLPLARQVSRPIPWLVVMVGFGVARNLPWYPFTLLAPG